MKTIAFIFLIAAVVVSCKPRTDAERVRSGEAQKVAEATGLEYRLVKDASEFRWRGSKPGGEHYGTVQFTQGQLRKDEGRVTGGVFEFDLNTIVSEDINDPGMNARLVNHLKSEDFFYVEEYPVASFEIVSVIEKADGVAPASGGQIPTHEVTGNLTMRGTTKSITFPLRIEKTEDKVKAVANPFAIDRTEWNVNYNSKSIVAGLTDNFIDDMMIISMELEFRAI